MPKMGMDTASLVMMFMKILFSFNMIDVSLSVRNTINLRTINVSVKMAVTRLIQQECVTNVQLDASDVTKINV